MPPTKANNPSLPTPITSLTHADKRVNIPTEELRGFVEDDEKVPITLLYPRDPSLDPQLVWKGKDEQDRADLAVPAVPIYIQEKIQPQAIIEDLRARSRSTGIEGYQQAALFETFDGLDFADMVDFYKHEQNWSNRMILGDSLLVMASLAEKEGLKGQVQMIYIDPPYGIKFGSNWQVSTRDRDVKDGRADDLTRQPEQVRAFRDTWEHGIHSYLAYLRDRLVVARDLLAESGSVFVQIGDANVHYVRALLDEVFGDNNFCAEITLVKTAGQSSDLIPTVTDYIIWYAKDKEQVKFRQPYRPKGDTSSTAAHYTWLQLEDGTRRSMTAKEKADTELVPRNSRLYAPTSLISQGATSTGSKPFIYNSKEYKITGDQHWKTSRDGMTRLAKADRIHVAQNSVRFVRFINDFPGIPFTNFWDDTATGNFTEDKIYVVQTATKIIERCLVMTTDPGDLVLDPTCGSGTTAYVAEQWGRRWITIDTSRVALALARSRLMAGRYSYYVLAASSEGAKKESELSGSLAAHVTGVSDIKRGFVYKSIPHITLKGIANNEEIDIIHARYQEQLEPLRAQMNSLLNQSWEEWQVPREGLPTWSAEARKIHSQWWQLRYSRQDEINASIARHADTEILYDQPYDDPKKIRVTGPFTVESLSPHRVLSFDDDQPASQSRAQDESEAEQFVSNIIENMRKAGVQNTYRNERLRFDSLEPYPGTYLNAAGEYTDTSGQTKRVALFIGPKYGTVSPDDVKEAAKEALKGIGFDLLIIAGLAFDPAVSEEVKRFGKLTILPTRINSDLALGDAGQELLKKTGVGNLFTVFGEPDMQLTRTPEGKIVISIRGLDIYDPTNGQIRNSSTDEIACWFIDTNYNEEAFFVRHAYFTGANEPYEKLKKALKAEIDEGAWSSLYSTESRPFDEPSTHKIAIKVINHYGDEVLKVYDLQKVDQPASSPNGSVSAQPVPAPTTTPSTVTPAPTGLPVQIAKRHLTATSKGIALNLGSLLRDHDLTRLAHPPSSPAEDSSGFTTPWQLLLATLDAVSVLQPGLHLAPTEMQASLLWVMADESGRDFTIPEEGLKSRVDEARALHTQPSLTDAQLTTALARLTELGCVRRASSDPPIWQVVDTIMSQ